MTERFNLGEVCVIVADVDGFIPGLIGRECTIVGPLELRICGLPGVVMEPTLTYLVSIGEPYMICCRPQELKRRRPPAEPLGRWEERPWRPERERV